MFWFSARALGFSLPVILLFYISEEALSHYFLLFQIIQVLGLLTSAGFTSLIIDLDRSENWLTTVTSNSKIFIILFIFLLGACWAIWTVTDGAMIFFVIGATLFGCRLFLQTLMRKYYEETYVIIASEITYSLMVLMCLLNGLKPELTILTALLMNFVILGVMSRSTISSAIKNNLTIQLPLFFKRSLTFGIQSSVLPTLVLIYLLSVNPGNIIEVKLAFMTCAGLVWLQSSIKSFYLRNENATFRNAINTYKFKIIFVFLMTVLVYLAAAGAMFMGPELISNKVELGILLLLSFSLFCGNVIVFITVLVLKNAQWKLYAGRGSGKLALVMVVMVLISILIVNYSSELWAISASYFLYCAVTSIAMFRLSGNNLLLPSRKMN